MFNYHRLTMFWNGYSPYKSGRKHNYFHLHNRAGDEAAELFGDGFAALSHLPLGEMRRTQSAKFDWDGDAPEGTLLHNVGVFVFELEDDSYDSLAVGGIKTGYFDARNFLIIPPPPEVENFIQLTINGWTPRPGVAIRSFVGGYFGIARQ